MSYEKIHSDSAKFDLTAEKHPGIRIWGFSITPSETTCPNADKCVQGCYGRHGRMGMSIAVKSYDENLAMVMDRSLWRQLDAELTIHECTCAREGVTPCFRLHMVGDFFDMEYARNWMDMMARHPDIRFYGYTKMVSLFHTLEQQGAIPDNFSYVFSKGGKEDDLIRPEDRVCDIVDGEIPDGYVDASKDEWYAMHSGYRRLAIRYHGSKDHRFVTLG